MVDTAVGIFVVVLLAAPFYYVAQLNRKAAHFVFFLSMTALAAIAKYYTAPDPPVNAMVEAYMLLSMVASVISLLWLMIEYLREYLGMLKGRA